MGGRGAQVLLEGYARDIARGGVSKTMRDNVAEMQSLVLAGLVSDGNTSDGSTLTGGHASDVVVAQFPNDPLHEWEIPTPLLNISGGGGTNPLTVGVNPPDNTITLRTSPTQAQIVYNSPTLTFEASTFAGTIVGNVLTITGGFQGTINIGHSVYWNNGSASGVVISGSGLVWTLDKLYPAPIVGGASFSGSISGAVLTINGAVTGTLGAGDIVFWSGGSDTLVGHNELVPTAWDLAHDNGSVPLQAMTSTTHMVSNNKESVTQFSALSASIQGTIPPSGINNTSIAGLRLGTLLDNCDFPNTQGLDFIDIAMNATGANFDGSRYGIRANLALTTAVTFVNPATTIGGFYINSRARASAGGTAGRGNGVGNIFGGVLTATSGSTSGYWRSVVGLEIDLGIVAGAHPESVVGFQIVHQKGHGQQGVYSDIAMGIGDQGGVTAGWAIGISVGGPNSQWPIDQNGLLWRSGYGTGVPWSVDTAGAKAAGGFDVHQVDFSGLSDVGGGFAFRADGARIVPSLGSSGGGLFQAGAGEFSGVAAGASLDTTFSQMTGTPTVAAGGSGWRVGDTLADQWGNFLRVATITGDAIATVTVIRRGWQNTPPSNPVAFSIITTVGLLRLGAGATFNLTWTAATTLNIGATAATQVNVGRSGQSLGFYGASATAKPTGVAVTAEGIHAALVSLGLIAA